MKTNDIPGYRKVHHWVEDVLGKPKECHNPKCTGASNSYDWANISGDYKYEASDWIRLCRKCHLLFDGKVVQRFPSYCGEGHKLVISNIYPRRRPSGTILLICKICRQLSRDKYNLKLKEI